MTVIDLGDAEPDEGTVAGVREYLAGKDAMERLQYIGACATNIDFGSAGVVVWNLRRLRAMVLVDAEMTAASLARFEAEALPVRMPARSDDTPATS
jgi:hypothetical protein